VIQIPPKKSSNKERMLVTCAGILVADLFATDLPKIAEPGEVMYVPREIEIHVGGHSANVSIGLRQLGLSEGEVSSVGAVGDDVFADFIERVLKKHGVVAHLQRVREAGTSKDLVLVVKGQDRRYHVYVGANWHLSPNHVRSVLSEEKPLVFYVGATGMMGKFDTRLSHILQCAKNFGCLTFVDPIVPLDRGWDFLSRASKWIDILHCNDVEASSITGERDSEKSAEALTEKGIKFVIVTMGERGLIAKTGDIAVRMPAFKVPVIDPSGAGDAFCAGLINKLVKVIHKEPEEASKLSVKNLKKVLLEGAASGAACVTAVGTTTAVTRKNVNRLLKQQGLEVLNSMSLS